jgi:murein DD-endopeptidase MepM/ murein hydrolase activator NlpD
MDFLIDFSHNSKIERLERTNTILQDRLADMKIQISAINADMKRIAEEDDQLRLALGLEKLNSDVRMVGIGGAEYDYSAADEVSGLEEEITLNKQLSEVAKLQREVKLEYESYKTLVNTFHKKQDSLEYLPALRPVLGGHISSRFGSRNHPILGVRKHHEGLDISAKRGTPVYASAKGIISFARRNSGYGNMIRIDHKYGFQTVYGHLHKILVRPGQTVKRGEKIGEVGSTGLSTAPHLHYEVRFKDKALNPSMYYFPDQELNEKVVSK